MTRESDIATMLDEWRTWSEHDKRWLVTGLARAGGDAYASESLKHHIDKILADRARLGDSDMQNDIYVSPPEGYGTAVLAEEEHEQRRASAIEVEAESLLIYLAGSARIALSDCGADRGAAADELRDLLADWADTWAERMLKARAEGAEPQHTGDDWVDGYPVRRP